MLNFFCNSDTSAPEEPCLIDLVNLKVEDVELCESIALAVWVEAAGVSAGVGAGVGITAGGGVGAGVLITVEAGQAWPVDIL